MCGRSRRGVCRYGDGAQCFLRRRESALAVAERRAPGEDKHPYVMSHTDDEGKPTQTYALRLTERAQRDMDAATVHVAETASPEVAIAWREGLYEALASLATFPRRCLRAPERFRREVHQILYRRP